MRKVAATQPGLEAFTLGLASEADLPSPRAIAIVTDLDELDAWRSRSRSAEEHLERSHHFTAEAKTAYESAKAAYESANADYLATRADYENALAALEACQRDLGHSQQGLQRANTLLAERNAALRIATDELVTLQAQAAALTAEVGAASASLAILTASRSWRITAPLRGLGRAWRTIRKTPAP